MATGKKADAPRVRVMYEVLTRRPDGHETVVRYEADSAADARRQALAAGVPEDQVVEVREEARR